MSYIFDNLQSGAKGSGGGVVMDQVSLFCPIVLHLYFINEKQPTGACNDHSRASCLFHCISRVFTCTLVLML